MSHDSSHFHYTPPLRSTLQSTGVIIAVCLLGYFSTQKLFITENPKMDSDDDFICDDGDMYDSGNEDCSEDDEEDSWIMDTEFEKEPSGSSNKSIEEKYQFEVGLNSTEIFS